MEFQKLIEERYSVRDFKPEHLPQEIIEQIVSAGHLAPTGCNFQPQRILVLNRDEEMEKLSECTRCRFNAPTAMLICYNRDESWVRPYDSALAAPVDAAIVTTHLMLKAHELGVGTCWVMHFNPAAMREKFNIPENIIPEALLVMGYPSENAEPSPRHSDFRSLDEVVVYGSF